MTSRILSLDVSRTHALRCLVLLGSRAGALGLTVLEAVLESSRHVLEVAHAAGTDGLSALALLAPVVCFDKG